MSRPSSTASSRRRRTLLHLDTFSGISGNMFVAALLDAGLSRKELDHDLRGLGLEFRIKVSRVQRGALAARYLDVLVPDSAGGKRMRSVEGRDHHHAHDSACGRSYRSIVSTLKKAKLDPAVRLRALAIFEALGRAEARVHGRKLADVHFHEVGAVDAIVDITAAAIGLHRLGIERLTASPVALGYGTVQTAHGELPLPAPATMELLRGIPTVPANVAWETVTPTGAAILRVCVDEFCTLPAMEPLAIGYGAGGDRKGPMPNVLRAVLGRSGQGMGDADRIVVLETNLDDLVPEHFDHLMERLFEAGALDVGLQHLQMKKNRPGFLVRVLAKPIDRRRLAELLFAESTAIGVRTSEWDRLRLERRQRKVDTPFGRIRVKLVTSPDGRLQGSPEYDDCKRAARKHEVSLREVLQAAEQAAREVER